jgi:hypothetical protein
VWLYNFETLSSTIQQALVKENLFSWLHNLWEFDTCVIKSCGDKSKLRTAMVDFGAVVSSQGLKAQRSYIIKIRDRSL